MMKKILVVLLVLAVATGVFAQQGEWSLSGGVVIGTGINLDPVNGDDLASDGEAPVASVTGRHYNDYDSQLASLKAAYNLEGLKVYLGFKAETLAKNTGILGGIEYYGERFALAGEASMNDMLVNNGGVSTLWGWYRFLDFIKFEAAYKSKWDKYWTSDETAGIINAYPYPDNYLKYSVDVFPAPWDGKSTWGLVDGHNYLLTNVELDSLQFGIKIPVLFREDGYYDGGIYGANNTYKFVKDSLLNSVVGLKFGLDMIEVAAQFYMRDYGVYFGGHTGIGPVGIGLSFMGILGEKDPVTNDAIGLRMKFGGKVDFNADAFSAAIAAFYGLENTNKVGGSSSTATATQIGIEPGFSYNVIPTHLVFKTDIGFYFNGGKLDGTKLDLGDDAVYWGLRPQLFWNFLGTGPQGSFDDLETGIIVRYTLISGNRQNTLDAIFKWSF